MRTTVSDKATIFAHERRNSDGSTRTVYSTTLGKKKPDNTWDNGNLYVSFSKKGGTPQIQPGQRAEIEILNGWMDFYTYPVLVNGQPQMNQNGKPKTETRWGVFINEWRYVQQAPQTQAASLPDSFAIAEDDVPW